MPSNNSLRGKLVQTLRIRKDEWLSGGELERIPWKKANGALYKPSNVSRRLREIAEDGIAETKTERGTVFYRYIPQYRTITRVRIEGNKAIPYPEEVEV